MLTVASPSIEAGSPRAPALLWWSQPVLARLSKLGADLAQSYQTAAPFPHVVIDNFLPAELLEPVLEAFPDPETLKWIKFNAPTERKLAFSQAETLAPAIREALYFLNSAPVLKFLETLTGINKLISDPYFSGGGLHQIEPGGKLGVHADFNKLPTLNLDRRLNLLLYLNKDWKEEYGGCLELWSRDMARCEQTVLPVFNRCVVFSTTSDSYHGHPLPLACPPGRTRKSIATYYYTNGRPEEEIREEHSTLFVDRPGALPFRHELAWHHAKRLARAVLMGR
jgi:Rps23 Pro-64 3,4-dihydroxylase Tpa1-like proline 4-hydroxylase